MKSTAVRRQIESLTAAETKQEIGARLQRWPIAWSAAALALRGISQPRRAGQIRRYLESTQERKLRIGAGRHTDDGWLCVDLVPLSKNIVFMDATKPLPLPDNSFDLIVCEHMIEHLDLHGGRMLLSECRRILRAGGIIRVATPDLARVVQDTYVQDEADEKSRDYVAHMNSTNPDIPDGDRSNPVYAVNRIVRDWGHTFLYDERTLTQLLLEEGFSGIIRSTPGHSEHPELVGVERHQEEIGEDLNEFETMVLEAVSP